MKNITKDYIELISQYLDPLDIVRWSIACDHIKDNLNHFFYKRLIEKIDGFLREHFESTKKEKKNVSDTGKEHPTDGTYDDFVRAMKANGAIISGSFILQMINGKEYGKSDIDIYANCKNSQLWTEDEFVGSYTDVEIVLWAKHHHSRTFKQPQYGSINIDNIREFEIDNCEFYPLYPLDPRSPFQERKLEKLHSYEKFQVITLLNVSPKEFIMEGFDFDVLKNLFWYDDDGPHVEITDLNGILNNLIHFNPKEYIEKTKIIYADEQITEKRIKKYQERGFEFCF